MKCKDSFWSQLLVGICLIFILAILIPVGLFFLIFKFITMPFNYYKYRHSQYQKDFPHKFNFLDPFHVDNIPYSIIKENELPVEYIKWSKEYDMYGYFIYKDILLDFTEPFFFDSETSTFTFNPEEKAEKKRRTIITKILMMLKIAYPWKKQKFLCLMIFTTTYKNVSANKLFFSTLKKNLKKHTVNLLWKR